MDLTRALEIFGYNTIIGIDDAQLRKKYRKLMKVNHPDVGGSEEKAKEIIEANTLILEKLEELQKQELCKGATGIKTVFIKFDSLINIFNGGSVEVRTDKESMRISKNNINAYNVVIDTDIKVRANGIEYKLGRLQPRTPSDNYSITFRYPVSDLMECVDFEIFAYGKHAKLPVTQPNIRLNLSFDFGIKLAVILERQLVIDE